MGVSLVRRVVGDVLTIVLWTRPVVIVFVSPVKMNNRVL
jgi:hypothetical protein